MTLVFTNAFFAGLVTDDSPNVANVLSGVVFVLLSSLRPFAGLCNRVGHNSRKKCLFALLVLYIWLVSLLYAATVGVLAVSAP